MTGEIDGGSYSVVVLMVVVVPEKDCCCSSDDDSLILCDRLLCVLMLVNVAAFCGGDHCCGEGRVPCLCSGVGGVILKRL